MQNSALWYSDLKLVTPIPMSSGCDVEYRSSELGWSVSPVYAHCVLQRGYADRTTRDRTQSSPPNWGLRPNSCGIYCNSFTCNSHLLSGLLIDYFARSVEVKGKGRLCVLQHCCLETYCTLARKSSFIHLQRRCTHQAA